MSTLLSTDNPSALGQPVDRVDGRSKVTGGARYSAEFALPGLAYGVLLTSTAAERAPGVHPVLTHLPVTLTTAGPGLRSATITVRADK